MRRGWRHFEKKTTQNMCTTIVSLSLSFFHNLLCMQCFGNRFCLLGLFDWSCCIEILLACNIYVYEERAKRKRATIHAAQFVVKLCTPFNTMQHIALENQSALFRFHTANGFISYTILDMRMYYPNVIGFVYWSILHPQTMNGYYVAGVPMRF